jgi:RNA polymerase sigma-70 factor (ECF subfamily)
MGLEPGERAAPLIDFGELYRTHAHALWRFAFYLSGDAALADDLVSETFVRALTTGGRIEATTVRGYLFTIVRNLFLTHVRRERHQAPLDEQAIDERPGPEQRARGQSDLRVVAAALAGLPEIDRAAVLMRADDGLPYGEIAAALGISTAAAKVKVHRARLRMAERLQSVPDVTSAKERRP